MACPFAPPRPRTLGGDGLRARREPRGRRLWTDAAIIAAVSVPTPRRRGFCPAARSPGLVLARSLLRCRVIALLITFAGVVGVGSSPLIEAKHDERASLLSIPPTQSARLMTLPVRARKAAHHGKPTTTHQVAPRFSPKSQGLALRGTARVCAIPLRADHRSCPLRWG